MRAVVRAPSRFCPDCTPVPIESARGVLVAVSSRARCAPAASAQLPDVNDPEVEVPSVQVPSVQVPSVPVPEPPAASRRWR